MLLRVKVIHEYIKPLNHPNISLLIVLVVGFVLRVIKSLYTGIWVDEGVFFYMSWEILKGEIPYSDLVENNPFGMIYLISFLFYFTGKSVIGARILTALISLLTSFFLYLLGKEMYNQKIGFLAAIFYTFDPLVILFSYHVYMETYANVFLVLSAYFALIGKKGDKIVNYFISGIFIGIAFFMKQPSIIMVIVIAPFIFNSAFQKKLLQRSFFSFFTLSIGVFFVLLLISAYYFSIGVFDEYLYYTFTVHILSTSHITSLWVRILIIGILVLDNIVLWTAGALVIPIFLKNRRDADILAVSFFLITSLFLISLSRPQNHEFVQAIPPLCILASYSLNEFFKIILRQKIKIVERHFLIGLIMLLIVGSILLSTRSYVYARADQASLEEQKLVANYIKQHTSQDESIFAVYPAYYFLSERKCPSRYILLDSVTLEFENVDFTEILQTKRVRYAILTNTFEEQSMSDENKAEILLYIETHYQIEKVFSFRRDTVFIYKSSFW